ncbi:MAG: LysR family transcriptional regulator [Bacillota bacterium]|nr:LysR family transcriptional regulator [Bacillota bacterium]
MGSRQVTMLQIDYFLAVAQYLSFTEAAKMLYTSQPSVSKQISILEKQLGTDLFYRTKRSVHLTPAGEVLLKELSGINEHIDQAIKTAKDSNLCQYSTINIGCLDALDTGIFLRQFVNKFKCEHKNINLNFERHSFKILREKLLNGSLDLIFTLSFEIDSTLGLKYKSIFKTHSSIIISKDDPLAEKSNVTVTDLKGRDFVMISREESPHGFDAVVRLCNGYGFSPRIVKQMPNIESILLCVESGVGVTILDSTIRLPNPGHFKLYTIEEDSLDMLVAWRKENIKPSMLAFVDELQSSTS